MNREHLIELKHKFDQADIDQGGALELEEFVSAFGEVLGKGLSDKEIIQLFMRIDANSDGSVDWEEFINYIILETETLSHMRADHSEYINTRIPDPPAASKTTGHSDMITQLLQVEPSLSSDSYRYITGSRDGSVKIWSANNLTVTTNIQVCKNWITSLGLLRYYEKLAVGTSERSIVFYDMLKSNEIINTPVSRVNDLKGIPVSMDVLPSDNTLIVGYEQGSLQAFKFQEGWHICNTRLDCHRNELLSLQSQQISKISSRGNRRLDTSFRGLKQTTHIMHNIEICDLQAHSEYISKVKYINDLDSIFSCSMDKTIKQFDVERMEVKKTFEHHTKGVLSFVWCPEFKFIASCGEERHITLWNPYSRKATVNYLAGHNSAITDLALNNNRFQLISLGTDKVVKIWDIRNYQCIQTITDKTTYRPENIITGIQFNHRINSLMLTSKKINIWPIKATEDMSTSHEFDVTCAMYNPNFGSVISCDDQSNVYVWDLEDGKLIFKFGEAHDKMRITAMAFDISQRRLITGAHDGSIKMWNFNNGQCLREFNYDKEPNEISCLLFIGNEGANKMQHIVSVGWDKHVYVWPDENEAVVSWIKCLPGETQRGHTDDILSATYSTRDKLLVTGGQTGQMIVWHFETGFPKAYLHDVDPSLVLPADSTGRAIEELAYISFENLILSISANGTVRVWDLSEMKKKLQFNIKHFNSVLITCASLSPDETRLATADEVGNLKLTDISDLYKPKQLFFINAHTRCINSVQIFFSEEHDSTMIITSSSDKNVKLFSITGKLYGYFGQGKRWRLKELTRRSDEETVFSEPNEPPSFIKDPSKLSASGLNSSMEELRKESANRYFARERAKRGFESSSADVFRRIDISRFKVETIPHSLDELYKQRLGRSIKKNRVSSKNH